MSSPYGVDDDVDLELEDDWDPQASHHHGTNDLDLGLDTYDLTIERSHSANQRQVHVTAKTIHSPDTTAQAIERPTCWSRFLYYLFCCGCCCVMGFRGRGYGQITSEQRVNPQRQEELLELESESKSRDGPSLFIIDVDSEEEIAGDETEHVGDDGDDMKRIEGRELCDRVITAMEARSTVDGVWSEGELRIVFVEIGAKGVARLCKSIVEQGHSSSPLAVTRVEFGMSGIGPTGSLIPVRDLLLTHHSLRHLSIWGSGIADRGALSIAKGVSQNTTLHTLALNNNSITDKGMKYIADALASNRTLTSLDLSANPLTDRSARYLATCLIPTSAQSRTGTATTTASSTRPHPLEVLNLSSCSITSKGCQHLAQVLSAPSGLETLDLSSNHIDDTGVIALLNALTNNTVLTQLNLHSNQLGPDSQKAVQLSSTSSHHRVIILDDSSQQAALDELEAATDTETHDT